MDGLIVGWDGLDRIGWVNGWMGWIRRHGLTPNTNLPPQQVNTFTANYRGEPFMQALWDNRPLRVFTLGLYAGLFGLALELAPPANAYLQVRVWLFFFGGGGGVRIILS